MKATTTVNRRREQETRRIINGLRVITSAERQLSQYLAKNYRITGRQLGAIRIVSKQPGISLGELADRMYLHISTCSGIIDRLERKRLMIREWNPDDRRIMRLRVTPQGLKIVKSVPVTGFGFLMRDLEALRAAEVHTIWLGMRRLLKLLRMEKDVELAHRKD